MRHPGLIEIKFHIPVEFPLVMYSFQLATGLVVTRLVSITSVCKKTLSPLNDLIRDPVSLRKSGALDYSPRPEGYPSSQEKPD